MFHPLFAFIGLRYARAGQGNPFISFINGFSVAGIALGLAALICVSSVMNGFEAQLKQRILGITPHLLVHTAGTDTSPEQLAAVPHVQAVSMHIESEGLVQSHTALRGVQIQGVEPQAMAEHSLIARNMLYGSFEDLRPGEYGLMLGRALAIALDVRPGDSIRLLSAAASVYTPFGQMPSQRQFRVTGVFDIGSEMDDKVVLLNIEDAARLLRSDVTTEATTRLFLDDAFAYEKVEQALQTMELQSHSWRARQGPLFDAVKMEKNMMSLMLLLIVAVAAFNIVSALVMVVSEKQGDIAILRTQGIQTSPLMGIFLTSGLYNGIKGTLIGLVGGVLLATQLNRLMGLLGMHLLPGMEVPVLIEWSQVATMVGLSLLLCLLATLYPARRAMRVAPAAVLRYE
ncbi:lipoprotein-releasing ABC transporter permease subunit [Aliiglaciecola sp. CAU 1673]|uniref:lipoprotein-releasing ABC transporter permease subunit n=1 Tax=Aliiglaciecola sp. CAU 1673 TaxID=3032595 RepID=UPI0023DBE218|nr:lipoprotein-releasing ABC transporter permease subunit [Aliiglaciecola sp. CAU 1673]MDF2178838.1 lipoprotein-releasing ABC transporter permease subunit [Aliiglaciecola sp. CAU 1673]